MEAISLVGLAGTVLSIIDIVTRNISMIRRLQSKYRRSNLMLTTLVSQLTTLNAALKSVSDLVNSDAARQHARELLVDSQEAVRGCQLLVSLLDDRVQHFSKNKIGELTSRGKLSLLWDSGEFQAYLAHLNNQINALNVLLSAFTCRSILSEKSLLHKSHNKKVISLARNNTASLLSIIDLHSLNSRHDRCDSWSSNGSSALSRCFDFDPDLLSCRPYQNSIRNNLRAKISLQKFTRGKRASPDRHPSLEKGKEPCEKNLPREMTVSLIPSRAEPVNSKSEESVSLDESTPLKPRSMKPNHEMRRTELEKWKSDMRKKLERQGVL